MAPLADASSSNDPKPGNAAVSSSSDQAMISGIAAALRPIAAASVHPAPLAALARRAAALAAPALLAAAVIDHDHYPHLPIIPPAAESALQILELIAAAIAARMSAARPSAARRLLALWRSAARALTHAVAAAGPLAPAAFLNSALASTTLSSPARSAIAVGIAAEAAISLNNIDALAPFKLPILTLLTKSIFLSKTALPPICLDSLAPALRSIVDHEALHSQILPPVVRLILRSPETILRILDHCMRPLNLDLGISLRDTFADAILNQLKSSNESIRADALALFATLASKTSDADALAATVDLIIKGFSSKSPLPEQRVAYFGLLEKIPPLTLPSQRILTGIPGLVSKESSELAYTAALGAFGRHLTASLVASSSTGNSANAHIAFALQGLSDPKGYVRRAHLNALMQFTSTPIRLATLGNAANKTIDTLVAVSERVYAAGPALLDPKKETPSLAELCIATAVLFALVRDPSASLTHSRLQDRGFLSTILSLNPTESVLLSDKFYRRLLVSTEEQIAFADILVSILSDAALFDLLVVSDEHRATLANALIWILLNSSHLAQRHASTLLYTAVSSSVDILVRAATLVRLGLCTFFVSGSTASSINTSVQTATVVSSPIASLPAVGSTVSSEPTAWNDKPARSYTLLGQRAFTAIVSVLPKNSGGTCDPAVELVLMDLAIVASLPALILARGSDVWVSLCFRCGMDPRDLLEKHAPGYVTIWIRPSNAHPSLGGLSPTMHPDLRTATLACLRLAAEISTRTVLKTALPHALSTICDPAYKHVTRTDVLIWSTPSDELFDDPAVQRNQDQDSGFSANSEEKWERELKKELAAKRAAAPSASKRGAGNAKLSKADKEARQQQFVAEAAIRANVNELKIKLDTALDVLMAVVDGIQETIGDEARAEFGIWVGRIVDALLAAISREWVPATHSSATTGESGVLAGSRAVAIYAKLAHVVFAHVADQVDAYALAATILCAMGVNQDAFESGPLQKYAAAPLAGSVRAMLESFAVEFPVSSPLEAPALTFVFPLLRVVVLRQGRIERLKEKTRTSLVMAASDVLIAHCAVPGSSLLVPRHDIAMCLVRLLEEFPRLRTAARGGLLALVIAASADDEDEGDDVKTSFDRSIDDDQDGNDTANQIKDTNGFSGIARVLLDALLSAEDVVRDAALTGLSHLPSTVPFSKSIFETRIWITRSDAFEAISTEATRLWEDAHNGTDALISRDLIPDLVVYVTHSAEPVRESTGRALCVALTTHTDMVQQTLELLYDMYSQKAADPTPEYDEYGMIVPESLNKPDEWEARSGIAHAIKSCVSVFKSEAAIKSLFSFLIDAEALGDKNSNVQQRMLDTGLAALHESGKEHVRVLLDVFDGYLSRPAKATQAQDRIRGAVVIFLGNAAQHLDVSDPRIPEVIAKLVKTLRTPSELVQAAVAECLPALIRTSKSEAPKLIASLTTQLLEAEKYGDRRGAAYGLAGIVKGYGISALKEFGIMTTLKAAVEDKKNATRREGAMLAYETLSYMLGRSFEPYVIQILPLLLVCFGDSNKHVRQSTEDTCRVIMSKLSAHCVKLVLPSLLNGLAEKTWRAKAGSIDVMSSMSALAPKQLSQSLPMIVPSICDALTDSHQKVQEAAQQALVQFGDVIKNPEIQELVPTLIAALVDPNHQTEAALAALLETTFVHYVDAPSLALLVPIIHRGLRERSAEIKKKAAQITGNMSSLSEQSDLVPYLQKLLPSLKEVLVDPVPEARATAARAFGSMVEKLGEDNFPGLVAELLEILKSDMSSVDRSGAAQGLSEVLAGLGIERLEGLLPEIAANTASPRSYTREGFTTLLVYLPATFGERFTPYLPTIIPCILQGLADENDTVRNAALQSGQVIVRDYARPAISLLLPELERGLFDLNWRIRYNSMQLLGDLLFRIAGVSGKVDVDANVDQDEGLGTEHGRQALRDALGLERYEKVLASIYIVRNDSSVVVRQSSLQVWKIIVTNTPRTLKDILPEIMKILLASLASSNVEKRGVAARTLGDLVRRMGEAILNDIIPILEKGLVSDDADTREGVCVGMTEIMVSAGKSQVADFVVYCTPLVKRALLDPLSEVREAAAQAFDVLHQHLGNKAIDDILPSILADLKSDSTGVALEALKEIMAVRSNVVFPVLIPTLITNPITSFNARALGSLISVAGGALNRRLGTILPALLEGLYDNKDAAEDLQETLRILMGSIQGDDGVHTIMIFLKDAIHEGNAATRRAACDILGIFFENVRESFEPYVQDWVQVLIGHMAGGEGDATVSSDDVLRAAWHALDALIKRIKKDDLDKFVTVARRGIRDAQLSLGPDEEIPGFNLPKGISPILPVFLQGLMYGSADTREQAAHGIGDLVKHTSETAIKLFVTPITGPLIRVVGDRFPSNVKSAILQTLAMLLMRVPAMLRPFLPQLQRTFVKSLSDASGTATMRDRAARCLSLLIPLQSRLDPLVAELIQGIKSNDDAGVKPAVWEALCGLLRGVGKHTGREISDASRKSVESLLVETISHSHENETAERAGAAKCFGALCAYIPVENAQMMISSQLLSATDPDASWSCRQGVLFALQYTLEEASDAMTVIASSEGDGAELMVRIAQMLRVSLTDDKSEISDPAVVASDKFLKLQVSAGLLVTPAVSDLIQTLVQVTLPGMRSIETRRESILALKNLAKSAHEMIEPHLAELVPALMSNVRDRAIPIKLAAERALVHVLQVRYPGNYTLTAYLATLEGPAARSIGDYARRVLVKIGERDSDTEDAVYD